MSEHVILRSFQKRGPFHDLKHPTLEDDDEIAALSPPGLYVEEHKSTTKNPPPPVLNLLVIDGALVMEEARSSSTWWPTATCQRRSRAPAVWSRNKGARTRDRIHCRGTRFP